MDGFFNKSDIKDPTPRRTRLSGCASCKLNKRCSNPKEKPRGKGKKKILIIDDIPGRTHRILENTLEDLGLSQERDCWTVGSVTCRTPDGRTPTRQEIDGCRPNLNRALEDLDPHVVISLGSSGVESFLGDRWTSGGISGVSRWRGWTIPDREHHVWFCPTYHPSFIDPRKRDDVASVIIRQDLERALSLIDTPVPVFKDETDLVKVTTDPRKAEKYLLDLYEKKPTIAIDYETTGLKPDEVGHRIVTVGISEGSEHGVAFPLTERIVEPLRRVLGSPKIKMIAANMKFEQRWSMKCLDVRPEGWVWDTVEAAHVLDNRRGKITGVKFQSFVQFGLLDYSTDVEGFLKSGGKNGNAFNTIDEAPMRDLLIYNALDALTEFRLARHQKGSMI